MSADHQEQDSYVCNFDLMELDDLDVLFSDLNDAIKSDSISINPSYDSLSNTGASIEAHSNSSISFDTTTWASDNLDVKNQLHKKLMEKMKTEGKGHTFKDISTDTAVDDQLTPEEKTKRIEKQERNKEAARRSRQKKKDNDSKLQEEYKVLESENSNLKYRVQQLKKNNEAYENYLLHHRCSTRNIIAQQDHGDNVCQETGSQLLSRPDGELSEGRMWNRDDDMQVNKISEDLDVLSVSLKGAIQRPQGVEEILSSLQGDQSQLVISGSSYETDNCLDSPSYFIASQENADLNNLSQVKTITKPNFSSKVQGNYTNVKATHNESKSGVFKGNGHSLYVGNSPASARYINAWSTEMDDKNDEIEALREVSRTVQPPPEKKLRLE